MSIGPISAASLGQDSAFATVQNDLNNSASAAQVNEDTAAAQSIQLAEGILGTLNANTVSSSIDRTTALLQSVYARQSGLDVFA